MTIFKEEIERLVMADVQAFANNAISLAPDSFKEDEEAILHTKKVFKLVEEMLDFDKVSGSVRDVILTGVLLSDVGLNADKRFKESHPLLVRDLLKDVENELIPQLWEGIMRIVESHEGRDTKIKDLEPKPGTPEHLVAIANTIARSKSVTINL